MSTHPSTLSLLLIVSRLIALLTALNVIIIPSRRTTHHLSLSPSSLQQQQQGLPSAFRLHGRHTNINTNTDTDIPHIVLQEHKQYSITVSYDHHPNVVSPKTRLDSFLADSYSNHTRSYLAALCDEGLVFVNNKTQTKSYKVKRGDVVKFSVTDKQVTSVEPEDIPLDILFEDDDIIAVNKPAGMVVHPAVGSPNGTFVNALLFHLGPEGRRLLGDGDGLQIGDGDTTHHGYNDDDEKDEEEIDGGLLDGDVVRNMDLDLPETPEAANASPTSLRPGIVHRLDKGTSGVLIAGKSAAAVARLSKLFALREVRKVYLAVCVGHPGETTIVNPIGRSPKNRQLMCSYEGPPGKPAISHIRTLFFDGKLSVCLVRIETGRTHQIRVHLKERRTPIIGDDAYGNADWNKRLLKSDSIARPLLHAYETVFINPFTQKEVVLTAPIPSDMAALIDKMTGSPHGLYHNDVTGGVSTINSRAQMGIGSISSSSSSISSSIGSNGLIDPLTRLLVTSTEVRGGRELIRDLINPGSSRSRGSSRSPGDSDPAGRGFVPIDRVVMDDIDNDWLNQVLPETNEYMN